MGRLQFSGGHINMKAIGVLTMCLLLCAVGRTQQIKPTPTTDIKGWYIGETFYDWGTNPILGGSADVCYGSKVPRNLKQWCKDYINAKNGGQQQLKVPPFSFMFKDGKVMEVNIEFKSFDEASSLAVSKFGPPTKQGAGGDIVSLGVMASGTGRTMAWVRQDGAVVMLQETILSGAVGVTSSTTITIGTTESLAILYPSKGYHPASL